jgi:hypothetical protein
MSLKVITGYKGSGKTCLATKFAYEGFLIGKPIFSNYSLAFDYQPIDIKDMLDNPSDVKDGIILIDEAQTWVDCRMAGAKKNRLFSYLMLQGRKRRIDIIMTSQQLDNVDIRVRRNLEHLYNCIPLVKDVFRGKGIMRAASDVEIENHRVDLIKVTWHDYSLGKIKKTIFDPAPYFELYDSDEFVDITG